MTNVVREQLNTFQQLFGKAFWKKTMIEVTFWSHDKKSKKRRKNKRDEEAVRRQWDSMLKEEMGVTYDVPVVFIDPEILDGDADKKEIKIFELETEKLKNFTSLGNPYECSSNTCKQTSFSAGLPTLEDTDVSSKRYGDYKIQFKNNLVFILILFSQETLKHQIKVEDLVC